MNIHDPVTLFGWHAVVWGKPITVFALVTLATALLYLATRLVGDTTFLGREGRTIAGWAFGVMGALYLLGWLIWPTTVYTFRVTLEVEVDGALRTGSSVFRLVEAKGPFEPNPVFGSGGSLSVRGVAPIVDLGKHGALFASLSPRYDGPTGTGRGREGANAVFTVSYRKSGKHTIIDPSPRTIDPQWYPQFVWIPPSNGPEAAMPLLPSEFAAHIGPGVKMRAVRIEPSDELAAELVEPAPDWLKRLRFLDRKGTDRRTGLPNKFYLYITAVETGSVM